METNKQTGFSRRDFLIGAAGLGIAAGGCRSVGRLFDFTDGAPMHGFAAPKLPTIRVGVVGMGGRGKHFLKRAQLIPGIVVTAICDNVPKRSRLDMDVYDLAATCCLCELTEKSSTNRSMACDIPDFTRGAWRTNKPLGIVDIDLQKMGFGLDKKTDLKAV